MPDDDTPPELTLDELAKWIGAVEDKAWYARRTAVGLRFLLGNLVLQMNRNKLIDVPAFMAGLLANVQDQPPGFEKEAMQDLVQEVLAHLPADDDGAPAPGTVFH